MSGVEGRMYRVSLRGFTDSKYYLSQTRSSGRQGCASIKVNPFKWFENPIMEVAFWFWIATLFATQYVNADRFISAPIRRRSDHHGTANRNRTVSETLVNSIGTGTYLANSICDLFSCA